jgi:hypothetical protein
MEWMTPIIIALMLGIAGLKFVVDALDFLLGINHSARRSPLSKAQI